MSSSLERDVHDAIASIQTLCLEARHANDHVDSSDEEKEEEEDEEESVEDLPSENPVAKRARREESAAAEKVSAGGKRQVDRGLTMDKIGARDGEVFVGVLSTNADAIIKIYVDETVPDRMILPSRKGADYVASDPKSKEALMKVPFFADNFPQLDGALRYLKEKSAKVPIKPAYRVFESMDHVTIHFLDLGRFEEKKGGQNRKNSIFANPAVVPPNLQAWLCEAPHTYKEIGERIPQLLKENGTLVSGIEQWAYRDGTVIDFPAKKKYPKVKRILNMYTGHVLAAPGDGDEPPRCRIITLPSGVQVASVEEECDIPLDDRYDTIRLGQRLYQKLEMGGDDEFLRFLARPQVTTGQLKSLVQKLVRFGARNVAFEGRKVSINAAIIASVAALCARRGYFNPDLGIYVTGAHSFAKRLLVILTEDAAPAGMAWQEVAVSLATASLVSKDDLTWFPSISLLSTWTKQMMAATRSNRFFRYQRPADEQKWAAYDLTEQLERGNNALAIVSALFDYVGGFTGDKMILREIAHLKLQPLDAMETVDRPYLMPIEHFIDHHVNGSIIYYIDLAKAGNIVDKYLQRYPKAASSPPTTVQRYEIIFKEFFAHVTGWNRRVPATEQFDEDDPIVRVFREAQTRAFYALYGKRERVENIEHFKLETRRIEKELDDRWLAAMVGDIKVKVQDTFFFVVFDVDDIHGELKATKKPARGEKDSVSVDETLRMLAIAKAGEMLERESGYRMNACTPPHPSFQNASVRRVPRGDGSAGYDLLILRRHSRVTPWEEARHVFTVIGDEVGDRARTDFATSFERLKVDKGEVELHDATANIEAAFRKEGVTRAALVRLSQWLSAHGTVLKVGDVSRDPSVSKEKAMAEDVFAFQKLLYYVAYQSPAAIAPVDGSLVKFHIRNHLVLDEIRQIISKVIRSGEEANWVDAVGDVGTDALALTGQRQDLAFQQEAITQLYDHLSVGRNRLLWMPPGAGKTYIVLSVLTQLAQNGLLPKHVLYWVPASAVETVSTEMTRLGFPVIKGKVPTEMEQQLKRAATLSYKIIVVHEDWNRNAKVMDILSPILPDSVCIFDEMHKLLYNTIRSANALIIARTCRYFIGMTGTPIINADPMMPAQWLSLVLDYDVTKANVFTSMGAFLTIEGHKDIPREEIVEDVTDVFLNNTQYLAKRRQLDASTEAGLLLQVLQIAWAVVYPEMARLAIKQMEKPSSVRDRGKRRVMIIVQKDADVGVMTKLLVTAATNAGVKLTEKDIFGVGNPAKSSGAKRARSNSTAGGGGDRDSEEILASRGIINFTDLTVEEKKVPDYRIIIVPIAHDTGYSLSRAEVCITSVYPSNQATRTQLEGRLNRVDQRATRLTYITVTGGILSDIYRNYASAQSLQSALKVLTEHKH